MKRLNTTQIVLWLFVLSATILIGGGIFEHVVLTPLWAGSPPESVTAWQYGVVQAKFFSIASPLYGLFSLALIIASFWMPTQQRKWALVAGICGIIVMLTTIFFFIPILSKTQATRGAGLSGEEIIQTDESIRELELRAICANYWRMDCRIAYDNSIFVRRATLINTQSNNSMDVRAKQRLSYRVVR